MSFIISLGIAIVVVGMWAWLGDWSQSRARKEEDEYWQASELSCPLCMTPYSISAIESRWVTFSEIPCIGGASFRCSNCSEIGDFERTTGCPRFIGFAMQARICCHCNERYSGNADSLCPICGETDARLAAEPHSNVARNESATNRANHRSGGGQRI